MKRSFIVSLMLLVIFVFSGCSGQNEEVVATVNGEEITKKQFDEYYNMLKKSYESEAGKLDEKKDKTLLKNIQDKAYEDLVLQVLIKQQAEKEGIKVQDKEVENDLKSVKERMGEKGYKDFIERTGITEKELLRQLKVEKMYNELRNKVTSGVKVSDDEVEKYYEENKDMFVEPGGIKIYHILVDTEDEAKKIIEKIKGGEDFDQLAQKYSKCPSKEEGGDLGIVNENTNFVAPFKEAALKLKPGEITKEPVKTEFGYHVIKAGESTEAKTRTLEEVKEDIRYRLLEYEKDSFFVKYLDDLKNKAEIVDKRKNS